MTRKQALRRIRRVYGKGGRVSSERMRDGTMRYTVGHYKGRGGSGYWDTRFYGFTWEEAFAELHEMLAEEMRNNLTRVLEYAKCIVRLPTATRDARRVAGGVYRRNRRVPTLAELGVTEPHPVFAEAVELP